MKLLASNCRSRVNEYMAKADVVLGLFGDVDRAMRAIPNKVYEGLAARKAVMNMDSPTLREIFLMRMCC